MTIGRALLAALAAAALIGAGCSSGSAENGSGSGADETASRSLKFAACMREHGVSGFPDPDAAGDQEFVEALQRLDQGSAAWKRAIGACKDLRPPGLLGGRATSQEMKQRLEFAQCMRDNGIEDFPDPTRDGPLIDTTRIPSAAGRGALEIPGFQAAMEQCRHDLANALGDE